MHKSTVEDIVFEIEEIENQLAAFEALIISCKSRKPDLIETAALGSVLHSFYTGIERILTLIAKRIDTDLPSGNVWHRELLIQMSKPSNGRGAVLSQELFTSLMEYLNFRHYFRHSYEYRLDWEMMSDMVILLNDVWDKFKNDIKKFINTLKNE